jgi:hypothetical protein
MGHVRLGTLPKTRAWKNVIELIANEADVDEIAAATFEAADKAFESIQNDKGFLETVELMKELAVAAKSDDPLGHLKSIGIDLPDKPDVIDVGIALTDAVDRTIETKGIRSDFNELAHGALSSAVMSHLDERFGPMFPASGDEVLSALADLGKPSEFGRLTRSFFGKATNDSLSYFLSQHLGTQVGADQPFATVNRMDQFEQAMKTHCHEAAEIVERFSGMWFSKNFYLDDGEIESSKTKNFGAYAMTKMRAELKMRADNSDA